MQVITNNNDNYVVPKLLCGITGFIEHKIATLLHIYMSNLSLKYKKSLFVNIIGRA